MPNSLISDGLIYFISTKEKANLSKSKAKFRIRLPPLFFSFSSELFLTNLEWKITNWEILTPSVIKDWGVARDVLGTLIHQLGWPTWDGKKWPLRCSELNVNHHHFYFLLWGTGSSGSTMYSTPWQSETAQFGLGAVVQILSSCLLRECGFAFKTTTFKYKFRAWIYSNPLRTACS